MFGLSFGEVIIILVVGLLVLGPSRLPQMARTLGRTLREFRRTTSELKSTMEDEFYRMDEPVRPAAVSSTASLPSAAPTPAGTTAARPPGAAAPPSPGGDPDTST